MTVSQSLGEEYDPLGAHLQDPGPFYARARQEEPVFWSPRLKAWVVTRYRDIQEVLRQPDVFSSANSLRPVRDLYPETFGELAKGYPPKPDHVTSDGEVHKRLRTPFVRAISPGRVDRLDPLIQQHANALIDAFEADGRVELMRDYASRLPARVIVDLFGLDRADTEDVKTGTESMFQLGGTDLTPQEEAAAGRGTVGFVNLMAGYAKARRAEPREDLVSEVTAALAPGTEPLTYDQEAEMGWLLASTIGAGHITSADAIGSGIALLLTHPEQWAMLCQRPEMSRGAVEETLRIAPPAPTIFRVSTKDATVAGVDLPAGSELLLAFISANRDEELCADPEAFDITRPPTRHLSFGVGVHACVGNLLARKEVQISLETFARRLPGLRLASGQATVPVRPTVNLRGPLALDLEW